MTWGGGGGGEKRKVMVVTDDNSVDYDDSTRMVMIMIPTKTPTLMIKPPPTPNPPLPRLAHKIPASLLPSYLSEGERDVPPRNEGAFQGPQEPR